MHKKKRHLSHTLAWLPHFFQYFPSRFTSGAAHPQSPSDLLVVVQWQHLVGSAGPPLEYTSGSNVQCIEGIPNQKCCGWS